MEEFRYAENIVEGKKLKEWIKSDEGLVDYSKCEFRKNVSNSEEYMIYDLGEYMYDPTVGITRYHNGLDLARVAAVAEFDAPYDDVSPSEALEGDDYVRLFFDAFMNPTIQEFIMYFFHYMGVDIYISETCYRVFLKVRKCTEEEWKIAVEALYSKQRM